MSPGGEGTGAEDREPVFQEQATPLPEGSPSTEAHFTFIISEIDKGVFLHGPMPKVPDHGACPPDTVSAVGHTDDKVGQGTTVQSRGCSLLGEEDYLGTAVFAASLRSPWAASQHHYPVAFTRTIVVSAWNFRGNLWLGSNRRPSGLMCQRWDCIRRRGVWGM